MASTYKELQEKGANLSANLQATMQDAAAAAQNAQASLSAAKKPETDYNSRLTELSQQKYTPSDNVTAAQSYLQGILDNKPGSYQSKYTDQLQGLYNQIMNREKFSYDLNGDMLYRQYADQYQRMGQQAMMDTMGQAAAMTGGYGNSYAQTAGQQTYQGYLQKLNEMVPQFYQQAHARYAQEGEDLRNQYAMAQSADAQDYARHQDAYNQWADERSYAQSAADTAYSQDYTDYTNRLNMAQQTLQMEREDAQRAQAIAYDTAMAMIQKGTLPSADLLATAGISDADALALAKKYGYKEKKSSSGGSSGKKSSSSSSSSAKNSGGAPAIISPDVETPAGSKSTMSSTSLTNMMNQGANYNYQQKILDELKNRRGF